LKNNAQQWSIVEPIFAKVMTGENHRLKDIKIKLDKNGFVEECYMDIFYTPIRKDDWAIGGVQTIIFDTSDKVNALTQSNEDELKLRSLIEEAPIAICL
jgi:hypothetical protein